MKKAITFCLALLFCLGYSQDVNMTFITEGIGTVIGSTELVENDPFVQEVTGHIPIVGSLGESANLGEFLVGAGAETFVSSKNQRITIPLKFAYEKFIFGASVPYYFKRTISYVDKDVEASGVGDVSVNVGYGDFFSGGYWSLATFVKLPTGDDENVEDGYLAPLGTGSTDFSGVFSLIFYRDRFTFGGSALYKFSGVSTKTAEIKYSDDSIETVDYDIKNGDVISFNLYTDYDVTQRFVVTGAFNIANIGEGETDISHKFEDSSQNYDEKGISNKQDMFYVDFKPSVTYSLDFADFTLGGKIPVMTERNEDNTEEDREAGVFFKVDFTLSYL